MFSGYRCHVMGEEETQDTAIQNPHICFNLRWNSGYKLKTISSDDAKTELPTTADIVVPFPELNAVYNF